MTAPNLITCLRILLVPFFFTALVSYSPGREHERWAAFLIFFAASMTDLLDGFLARITHSRSELGRFLDPLADKLLLLSGFIGLLFVQALPYRPPLWITVTIVFRDLMMVIGFLIIFFIKGTFIINPNFLGKATTAFQMATLLAILLGWQVSVPLCQMTAVLTIVSFAVYAKRELAKL